jgi:hypothetical protein
MGARIDAATFNNPAVRVRRSNQKSGAITTIAMYWRERTKMDIITALAVSIGLLGTVATYLFLTIGTIQIWIGFVGWASFYHCGGGLTGLRKSVAANLWGVIMAYIALLLITQVNIGLPGVLWPSILVEYHSGNGLWLCIDCRIWPFVGGIFDNDYGGKSADLCGGFAGDRRPVWDRFGKVCRNAKRRGQNCLGALT